MPSTTYLSKMAGRVVARSNLDEKPSVNSAATPIVIGTIAGLLGLILVGVLVYLHLRRRRRDKKEWTKDPQELEDYGIDAAQYQQSGQRASKQQPFMAPSGGGSNNHNPSRDDLNSLARQIGGRDNPFEPNSKDKELR